MGEASIQLTFVTPDEGFAQVIGRALGEEFNLRIHGEFKLNSVAEQQRNCDVVMLDFRTLAPDTAVENAAFALMDEIKQMESPPPIIVLLADDDHALLRKAIENGAYDTVTSPPNMVELRLVLRRAYRYREVERELQALRSREGMQGQLSDMVVFTEPMQQVLALARKIAGCDVTVLVTGETGTGKELLARAIHRMSPRANNPFVAFSCANLPETLIEDELFGHERGAFTGAAAMRRGRFEAADTGTLFLDEIGDLALGLQAKLLRVLQQRSFERLGSNTPVNVNIRLVCATHRNLDEMVARSTFREDLYYRLNVVQIQLPPLRERREGIAVLGQHFLQRFAKQFGRGARRFSRLALRAMEEYGWPGNVRELENVVQRAVVIAEGPTIEVWHLPATLRNGFEQPRPVHSYEEEVREFKRRLILRTLQECSGSKVEAAKSLGIARGYLHRLINQLQIESEENATTAEPAKLMSAGRVM